MAFQHKISGVLNMGFYNGTFYVGVAVYLAVGESLDHDP